MSGAVRAGLSFARFQWFSIFIMIAIVTVGVLARQRPRDYEKSSGIDAKVFSLEDLGAQVPGGPITLDVGSGTRLTVLSDEHGIIVGRLSNAIVDHGAGSRYRVREIRNE